MIYLIVEQCEDPISSYYIFHGFFYKMEDVIKYLQSCELPFSHFLMYFINEKSAYNIEVLDGYPTFYKRN